MNILIAAAIAVVLAFGGGYYKGHSSGYATGTAEIQKEFDAYKAAQEKKYTETVLKYREKERALQDAAAAEQEKHRDQVRIVNNRLSAALVGLRNRPERRTPTAESAVPGATQTCTGVSGAELARGDGEFLAGYAADAAKQKAALELCAARYEAVRKKLSGELSEDSNKRDK